MERSRKRHLIGVAAALSAALFAAGCSADPAATDDGAAALSQSWWGGATRAPLQQAVIDLFVEENPDVSIEMQQAEFDAYWDRIAVQASGGNLPDVTQMQDRYLAQFSSALLDLQPFIDDGTIDISGIDPAVLASGQVEGKQVMIPSSFSYRGLEYDAELFASAGLKEPDGTTTWKELSNNLKKLATSQVLPAGTYAATNQCGVDAIFYSYLKSQSVDVFEGDEVAFNVDEAAEHFSYWLDLQNAGAVPPADFQSSNEGGTVEDSMFTKGMTALQTVPANQYVASTTRGGDIKLAGVPIGPSGAGNKLIVSGQSIGANSDNPREAAKFIDFFVNDEEAALAYQANNGIPSANSAREALSSQEIYAVDFYDTITDNFASFAPPPAASADLDASLIRACEQVMFGNASPKEAAETMKSEIEAQ